MFNLTAARTFLLAALLAGPLACDRGDPSSPAAQQGQQWWAVPMQIGNKTFRLEIADTPQARKTGLMHRKSMPADHGMIFVFDREQDLSFWMQNTHIPLDVIYLDGQGKVVSVKKLEPLDETGVPSDAPAKYAIELNRGQAAAAGVKPGDVLTIPDRARQPRD